MKVLYAGLILLLLIPQAGFAEDEDTKESWFSWNLLWTGSWNGSYKNTDENELSVEELVSGGTFLNRGDMRLDFPEQYISLRFQVLDRRRLPPESKYQPVFSPGFGFYYTGGGTAGTYLGSARVLRGVLEEQGLPARVRNVWAKSAPFAENRKPFTVDLKNEVSSTREPETSLFLETPVMGYFRGYAYSVFDDEFNPAFSGGMEARWSKTGNFRLDTFYTQRKLKPRKPSSWFSVSPPLPERDLRFWALGTVFNTENFGLAVDGAFSETFAYGSDIYASAGLRLGSKPWKFSLAADGAGPRFTDRAGAAVGAGFRIAGRLERQWIRSGLFRTNALLRSSSFGESYDRGSFSVYYRPSSLRPRENPWFRFTRASFKLDRDARTPHKTLDSFDALGGFNFGPIRSVFSWSLDYHSGLNGNRGLLFQPPFFENTVSSKIAEELAWGIGVFDIRSKLAHIDRAEKKALWDLSLNASFKPVKGGRVSLKIASPDFPKKWNYTLSYRIQF